MSWNYPEEKKMTERDCEFYVQGMYDLLMMVGGDTHGKIYDPLTFWDGEAHSYVLDLQDGGRHHKYTTPENVAYQALLEFAEELIENSKTDEWHSGLQWNEYYKENIEKLTKPSSGG